MLIIAHFTTKNYIVTCSEVLKHILIYFFNNYYFEYVQFLYLGRYVLLLVEEFLQKIPICMEYDFEINFQCTFI